jgi:hypothetical protein
VYACRRGEKRMLESGDGKGIHMVQVWHILLMKLKENMI